MLRDHVGPHFLASQTAQGSREDFSAALEADPLPLAPHHSGTTV